MDWLRALQRMDIGASIIHGQIAVARMSNNRFIVLKDGEIHDIQHSRQTAGLAIARTIEVITCDALTAPCSDCGAARVKANYCAACWSRRTQEYKRHAPAS